LRKREIVILHLVEERIGVDETNLAGILGGILRGDFRGTIGAVIVDEDVLPIRIGLAEDALNTLREEFVTTLTRGVDSTIFAFSYGIADALVRVERGDRIGERKRKRRGRPGDRK
jgi:hypothetical protein